MSKTPKSEMTQDKEKDTNVGAARIGAPGQWINITVNASRVPPRPLAGQRLQVARQQLEAWKGAPDSS